MFSPYRLAHYKLGLMGWLTMGQILGLRCTWAALVLPVTRELNSIELRWSLSGLKISRIISKLVNQFVCFCCHFGVSYCFLHLEQRCGVLWQCKWSWRCHQAIGSIKDLNLLSKSMKECNLSICQSVVCSYPPSISKHVVNLVQLDGRLFHWEHRH